MAFGELERDGFDAASATPMSDINVTPLVDVMLVLLVIFIITAPLMVSGLRLELPRSEAAAPVSPAQPLRLALDKGGRLFLGDQPIEPEALRQRVAEQVRSAPDTEVMLRADAAVPYGQVLALIGMVQGAGLSRIAFVAEPDAAGPPR